MTILAEFRRDPQRLLDRLVDGELGPHERRELLAALDDEPSGWRQCALAFLESQSWRLQLTQAANEPLVEQVRSSSPAGSRASGRTPTTWLAIAASMLVAFLLGTRFAGAPATEPAAGQAPQLATRHGGESSLPNTNAEQAHASDPATPQPTAADTDPVDDIRLAAELPADDLSADSPLAAARASSLSQALLDGFTSQGFTVDRRQQLWPVELPDGRQVIVPVEEVDIRAPEIEHL